MRNHTSLNLFGAGMALALFLSLPASAQAADVAVDKSALTAKQFSAKTLVDASAVGGSQAASNSTVAGPTGSEVIIRNPEGEKVLYEKNAMGYFGSFNAPNKFDCSELPCVVSVIRNGNKIYMNNYWSQYMRNQGYVEGTVEGDIATFTFPQYVDESRDRYAGETTVSKEYCLMFSFEEDSEHPGDKQYGNFKPSDNQTLKFRIEDGELVPIEQGNRIMGWAEWEADADTGNHSWRWMKYGDSIESIKVIAEKPLVAPANLKYDDYAMFVTSDAMGAPVTYGVPVKMAISNQDVYISGLFDMMPDACVKGTLADGKITIPSGQYMGYYKGGPANAYFVAATPQYYEYQGVKYLIDVAYADKFEFTYDAAQKKLTSQDLVLTISAKKADILYFQSQCFDSPSLVQSNLTPITKVPAPKSVAYQPLSNYSFPRLTVKYDNITEDNQVLEKSKLFLNLFVDGKQVKFTTDNYPEIAELGVNETYDIPMNFYIPSSKQNFLFMLDTYYLMIYDEVNQSLGVRLKYADGDTAKYSDIVYAKGYETGIEDVVVTDSTDANAPVAYYNLQGQRIERPAKGQVVIRVQGGHSSKLIF